jgi:deazaflavin-dependent oxidoreductase (nitroreductase family)
MNQQYANLMNHRQCHLTTYDRQNGGAHDDEMYFVIEDNTLFMVSWGGGQTTWVQNILRNPEVSLQVGNQKLAGMARVITDEAQATRIREMLASRYENWQEGEDLSSRMRAGLVVAVDLVPNVH